MNNKLFWASLCLLGTMLLWLFIWPGESETFMIVRGGLGLLAILLLLMSFIWDNTRQVFKYVVLVLCVASIAALVATCINWSSPKNIAGASALFIVVVLAALVYIKYYEPRNLNKRRIAR